MATFVLVHGSWHGGWCWRFVTPLLRAAGHTVYTPTLSGLGPRAHLLEGGVDLDTHIQDITSLLFYEDLSDVLLVGHSYAGMIISGVAALAPERLATLIYLDAYVPGEGQSEFDLWSPEERAAGEAELASGTSLRQPASPAALGITDPKMAAWVEERLTPHPLATYAQPAPQGGAAGAALPRVYIHCTAGMSRFNTFATQARAAGWDVEELATGHDAMLTVPQELSEMLLALIGSS